MVVVSTVSLIFVGFEFSVSFLFFFPIFCFVVFVLYFLFFRERTECYYRAGYVMNWKYVELFVNAMNSPGTIHGSPPEDQAHGVVM